MEKGEKSNTSKLWRGFARSRKKKNADVVVLDADLSSATKTNIFAKELPERFLI